MEAMSHHHEYKIDGYRNAWINVNGDWSGDAEVNWIDDAGVGHCVEIPGRLLLTIGQRAAFDYIRIAVEGMIEELEPPPEMRLPIVQRDVIVTASVEVATQGAVVAHRCQIAAQVDGEPQQATIVPERGGPIGAIGIAVEVKRKP